MYDIYTPSENRKWENFSFGFGGMAEIIMGQGVRFCIR
jgi:hypothetical protein